MKRTGLTLVTLVCGGMLSSTVMLCAQATAGADKPVLKTPAQAGTVASTNSVVQGKKAPAKPKVQPPFRTGPKVPDEVTPSKNVQVPRRDRNKSAP